jgi:hypothetical protein
VKAALKANAAVAVVWNGAVHAATVVKVIDRSMYLVGVCRGPGPGPGP